MLAFSFSCWLQRESAFISFFWGKQWEISQTFQQVSWELSKNCGTWVIIVAQPAWIWITFFLTGACLTDIEGRVKRAALFSFLPKLNPCVAKGTQSRQSRTVTSGSWRQSELVGHISGTAKLAAPWKTNSMFKHQDRWGTKWINWFLSAVSHIGRVQWFFRHCVLQQCYPLSWKTGYSDQLLKQLYKLLCRRNPLRAMK